LDLGFAAVGGGVLGARVMRRLGRGGGWWGGAPPGRYPAVPTFVLMLPYYLALLGAETAYLVKLGKK
jgi:hypothetical protein